MVYQEKISSEIANPHFCVHPTDDVIGAAIGGVMKNVVAIASGVAAGRKLGENARATVVTLGLAETVRLGLALGARRETFDGFAGIGDMMLTANSLQSRNTSLGIALAEGKSVRDVLSTRQAVTEGAFSAEAVVALAAERGVRMPIAQAVDRCSTTARISTRRSRVCWRMAPPEGLSGAAAAEALRRYGPNAVEEGERVYGAAPASRASWRARWC